MDSQKQNLQFLQVLTEQMASAIQQEHACPPVLRALIYELNLPSKYIAETIGVSRPTVSNWAAGRTPINDIHLNRMISLLRSAIQEAESVVADSDDPELLANKIQAARSILEELEAVGD